MSRIFLLGFMGCGKSTLGKKLAPMLQLEFLDLDAEIEKKESLKIRQIFEQKGEHYFREIEKKMLDKFFAGDNFLLAVGGGTPCFFDNIEKMNQSGITVYIQLPAITLVQRIENSKTERPLLKDLTNEKLKQKVEEMLKMREEFYLQSKIVWNPLNESIKGLVSRIELLKNAANI